MVSGYNRIYLFQKTRSYSVMSKKTVSPSLVRGRHGAITLPEYSVVYVHMAEPNSREPNISQCCIPNDMVPGQASSFCPTENGPEYVRSKLLSGEKSPPRSILRCISLPGAEPSEAMRGTIHTEWGKAKVSNSTVR